MPNENPPPPEIRLHEPAVDFIDNRLPAFHPAFANLPTRFNPASRSYVMDTSKGATTKTLEAVAYSSPIEPRSQEEIFPHAMKAFRDQNVESEERKKSRLSNVKIASKGSDELTVEDFNIRNKTSWDEVLQVLRLAQHCYDSPPGVAGFFRKSGRKIGDEAATMQQVVDFIPVGTYTAPVVEALKIIIQVASKMSDVRKYAKSSMESLASRFADIADYLTAFGGRPRIEEAALRLSVAILEAIEHVIVFYLQPGYKHLAVVLPGETHQKAMKQKLEKIKAEGDLLIEEAGKSHYLQGAEVHKTVGDIDSSVKLGAAKISEISDRMDIQTSILGILTGQQAELLRKMDEESEYKRLLAREREKTMRLEANVRYLRAITPPPPVPGQAQVSQANLGKCLCDIDGVEEMDLEYCIRIKGALKLAVQERAEWFMKHPKLKEWLVTSASTELLVHGNSDPLSASPLSFLCAMMVKSLKCTARFRTCHFFCGLHKEPRDLLVGAVGMIRALTAQLLCQDDFDLNFLDPAAIGGVAEGDVHALIFLFRELARQLSSRVVLFCVIDGINFFEYADHLDGMALVIRSLLDLGKPGALRSVFKILITSPSTTRDVADAFQEQNILRIPPRLPRTGHGFSQWQFESQIEDNSRKMIE